jgi:S-formylglutathione hydrolase FrmB
MMKSAWGLSLAPVLAVCLAGLLFSQSGPPAAKGAIERIKVRGTSLEGNLAGDSPDRDVSIYLPPGYSTAQDRRYPVVYLLHGYASSDEHWFGPASEYRADAAIDKALAKALADGNAREMILVMPNAFTVFQGSFYSNSAVTGDWESFIARDLVRYIDRQYRTIPAAASRGLAGHSMGGYGAARIGMKYPDVFSGIYVMSGCCIAPSLPGGPLMRRAAGIRTMEDITETDYPTRTVLATAAAWSPNPMNPPLFFDLPMRNGQLQPAVAAKWTANAVLTMADQHVPNLRKLRAIAIDAGDLDQEAAPGARALDQFLTSHNIPHSLEIYGGDHTSRITERLETKVLPFFTASLSFEQKRASQ